ncbi:hypothetical protein [Desertibacillus haloalkaliphilus]|uniref:hypothetical protein n=1 Tax=Desertibacillus haloalkaliphilus TaxID=1328930 RepID=UPI001C263911|nr:hypothetical protein [Desertibacillus haloalkaliphilus]MBU8908521.1 hypothetical protein [Desertibacillus haloalkaliphilus]
MKKWKNAHQKNNHFAKNNKKVHKQKKPKYQMENDESFREMEEMMGIYNRGLRRGKGGALK